ncbi:protein ELFN1 [Esox lucius]|uniref:ELFN1/ELFN2 fibronectin type-III domain-containing protein n=1 Tax=Esox lucius TaxID=8010 RepID=A0A3P9AGV5_ESOLU|nr:protein ELFN1 [Esox lucius]XP_028978953.1 protein ELFN1 [Esox lucius]XP_034150804.1 protein ELFN1 [Esox lucius]XP_034150805.1 protein ELFN1 [Esox lucius]XP_034150806.1 protein ELFN1 [Esox lucius]
MTSRGAPMACGGNKVMSAFFWSVAVLYLTHTGRVNGDCWLIEGEKGFVWLAICSQNQPPYEAIPTHINSTIVDLRLNENKIKSIHFSALSRFANLTYLNLTKNEINYIEDGAFSAQFNLQVLQLGFNKLRNLTEGILRGLTKLQYLYLQANLIETVTPNAFWECPNIENIDLSMNRIQQLDGNTFTQLAKLTTCELYTNPFNCSCELFGFIKWLSMFPNRTNERMVCDSPLDVSGYSLLNPNNPTFQNALYMLSTVCTEDHVTQYIPMPPETTTLSPDFTPCGMEDCPSGTEPDDNLFVPTLIDADINATMKLKQVSKTGATITVQIPHPFKKMYSLVLYNNSFYTDIQNLKIQKEDIELKNLKPHTNYTYCVVSIKSALRVNHTCLMISTGPWNGKERLQNNATATHYIMTILGCLFSMVIVLGVVYYCLRKKRQQDERQKKAGSLKKNIIELKYGQELEGGTISRMSQKQMMAGESLSRMPYLPSGSEMEQYKLQEIRDDTPKMAKGSYIEVRGTGDHHERRDCEMSMPGMSVPGNSQGSVAEISTIAKEVDKVNQIINNCIDALKSESTSFQGVKSGAVSNQEPQLVLISEQPQSKSGFLSPGYKDSYHHSLQRHHTSDISTKRPSTATGGPMRSPRPYRSESKYIEKTSPTGDTILTVTPAAAILRAEAEKIRQYSEHRHSYPESHQLQIEELEGPGSHKPSLLEPLTRPRPRDMAYSQLSPQYHNLSYSSSPEYYCKPQHTIWERFKLHRKRHKDEDEYMAAGHALRKKVQFAKDEDLHDILDYWKGVSAQQKS